MVIKTKGLLEGLDGKLKFYERTTVIYDGTNDHRKGHFESEGLRLLYFMIMMMLIIIITNAVVVVVFVTVGVKDFDKNCFYKTNNVS